MCLFSVAVAQAFRLAEVALLLVSAVRQNSIQRERGLAIQKATGRVDPWTKVPCCEVTVRVGLATGYVATNVFGTRRPLYYGVVGGAAERARLLAGEAGENCVLVDAGTAVRPREARAPRAPVLWRGSAAPGLQRTTPFPMCHDPTI